MSRINYKVLLTVLLTLVLTTISFSGMAQDGPTELERALAGEFNGSQISLMSVWTYQPGGDGNKFQAVLDAFNAATGITVTNEATRQFEQLIIVRAEGGAPPDVAVFPQPGLMSLLSEHLVPLEDVLGPDVIASNWSDFWIDLATINDQLLGIFYRASTKSLVWYRVAEFESRGYAVPTTWDEMQALMDQMVADGVTPWCIGIEQSAATGWVATDWVEEIVLRTAGLDVYQQWINHEIPFNDERIRNAVQMMGDIWLNPDYVFGGTTSILTTNTGDAVAPMFDDPPSCMMHRQAGWISSFFPAELTVPDDVTFFYFPTIDPAIGSPALGAGDAVSMFNDRPEVRAFIQWMATPDAARPWIELEGFISAVSTTPLEWYPNPSDLLQAEILNSADFVGFDASDLMPGEVGTGTFWTGMVDYVSGSDLDGVLQSIEDTWPE